MSSTPLGQMLIAAVEDGGRLWEIQHCIDDGAPLNETDTKGDTALIKAASKNDFDLVEILLIAGCDPNIPDRDGNTPLIRTIEFIKRADALDIVCSLLARGADASIKNHQGYDLMHYAEKWKDSHGEIYQFLCDHLADKALAAAEKNGEKPAVKPLDHTQHKNLRNYIKKGMKK